ncbi:MAG: DUF3078 domain-containing protein [Paludibacteraceae bacterium]|nr:DUF3078 domain-containing protein [Paludibacteraceae bacterium]
MKKHFLLFVACMASVAMMAQEEAAPVKDWQWSGIIGLNANATGMVNWAAGGKNNVTGTAYGKVRCLYDKSSLSWETNLDVAYGLSYVDQTYDKLQKASDYLKFNTKFGWAFKKNWLLTVSAGFQTQFDLGREYLGTGEFNPVLSNILAPSYTDISVGIDWKPNNIFSVYLSPVAGRITTAYVSDNVNNRFADEYLLENGGLRQQLQESYGVWKYTKGETAYEKEYMNAKAELGLTLKGGINWTYKDLKIITNLTLFTPYTWDKKELFFNALDGKYYEEDQLNPEIFKSDYVVFAGFRDNNRRFGNFDVDWNVAISYQFLKCLSISLNTDLKYVNGLKIADKEGLNATEKVQFLANLGIGVSYAF